ncbi:ABC-three component system protein [Poseidonibacter ostreae]|uniref:ABC-three component systems C-terminal domain-containing protein n=1 Tax=Poseidonibacter ostreae TaxID=2654171 RepID=A0A6L4WV52_9BACT|nr:ABC-three component system protein [Poseidonibacter ostreae]KAB7889543.1 hypothetical protein GBG19_05670 [Poseidonibacter ostreae]
MLNIEDWANCDIEKNGDISLKNSNNEITLSIEVKYHNSPTELKNNIEELWKTIHNFYNDSDKFTKSTKLELYTVSTISKGNNLLNWNNLNTNEKLQLLKDSSLRNKNEIYLGIKKFYNVIFQDENKLKSILSKFTIHSDQEYYEEFKEQIKKTSLFRIFNTNFKKDSALESLIAVVLSAFKNVDTWTISKEEFDSKLTEIAHLSHKLIVRVNDDADIEINEEMFRDSKFVNKLKDIEQDDYTIDNAIDDYAKTVYEVEERMNLLSSLDYNRKLESYENDLIREFRTKKGDIELNTNIVIKQSKQFYRQIQSLEKIPFIGKSFNDKTTFFQRGYYHILANDDSNKKKIIHWHLEK